VAQASTEGNSGHPSPPLAIGPIELLVLLLLYFIRRICDRADYGVRDWFSKWIARATTSFVFINMQARTILAHERLRRQHARSSLINGGAGSDYGAVEKLRDHGQCYKAESASHTYSTEVDWMSMLPDETLLSALTIPGTHDSTAYTHAWPFVQTQMMDVSSQLAAGIRYLDLRCGLRKDTLEMVHGPTYLGLTFADVLDTIYMWLKKHETEALIVQIKEDRKSEGSTVHFAQAVWQCLAHTPERWRTANTTPTLGELRGKIQLFRRFNGPSLHAWGIDVTQWQDNPSTPFTIYSEHQVQITIQDHYSFSDPEPLPSLIIKKGGDVTELFNRATTDKNPSHWFMNFTSAYEFSFYYQLSPREVAIGGWWGFHWEDGMNPRIRSFVRNHLGRQRYGIVAMDFPEKGCDDLIEALLTTNFEPQSSSDWCLCNLILHLLALVVLSALLAVGVWISIWYVYSEREA